MAIVTDPDLLERLNQEGEVDFSASEMASNIPSSAWQLVKDVASAIASPIDTGTAVIGTGAGLFQKILPGEQGQEKYADAMGEFIKERYGSVDKFQRSLMNDPVGVLSDLTLGVTGVGTGLKVATTGSKINKTGGKMSKTGMALDPINLAISTLSLLPKFIKQSALVSMYERAAKFASGGGRGLKKERVDELIQFALDMGIEPSIKGLHKIGEMKDRLNLKLEELIKSTSPGKTVPIIEVLRHIDELKKEKLGFVEGAGKKESKMNKVIDNFIKDHGHRGSVTLEELQNFKKDIYSSEKYKRGVGKASPEITSATRKSLARGAKDVIEENIPASKTINPQLGNIAELEPLLEGSSKRIANLDPVGLRTTVPVIAGAAGGAAFGNPLLTALGIGGAVLNSPTVLSKGSILANKLKKRPVGESFTMERPRTFATTQALRRADEEMGEEDIGSLYNRFYKNKSY